MFEDDTDDAIAEICLVDEDKNGPAITLDGNKKVYYMHVLPIVLFKCSYLHMQISKQKVDCLAIRSPEINTLTKNNDTAVENFPRCFLRVYEKLSPPCRLKIKGLHVNGQEYSDFDLASSTTASINKYQVSDDGQQDTHVDIISMFYIQLCV